MTSRARTSCVASGRRGEKEIVLEILKAECEVLPSWLERLG